MKTNGVKPNNGGNEESEITIHVEDTKLKQVNAVLHLGVSIERTGKNEVEINRRLDKSYAIL